MDRMQPRHLILCCFYFLSLAAFGQLEREVDSLKKCIATSKSDSLSMEYYNALRRITYFSNVDESLGYTQEYLRLAKKCGYPKKVAMARYYIGNAYVAKSQYDKALENYLKSAEYFEKEKDSATMASVYNGIGAAYEHYGNDSLSLNYFKRSYRISELLGDKRRAALAINNCANIYSRRGEYQTAIPYLRKAVDYLKNEDAQYLNPIRVNLANALADIGKKHEAKIIYSEVLKETTASKDAFTYLLAQKGLGTSALDQKNFTQAVANLEEAYAVAIEANFSDQRYAIMKDLIDAYYGNGDFQKGMDLMYDYASMRDSVFTNEKDENLTNAIQRFESERKDREIAERDLELANQQMEKNGFRLGVVLLALTVLVVFFVYRSRLRYQRTIAEQRHELQQRTIRELEQQSKLIALNSMLNGQETERMRIGKDLHDGLGGLLSTIKTHFSLVQRGETENEVLYVKTNDLIDEACVEVRRISHNMMPQALSISGLEAALSDLGESLRQEGIQTTIEIGKLQHPLTETHQLMIYRIGQQLIANIRTHANATHVLLQLIPFGKTITLTVEDDGVGFDKQLLDHADGIGIRSIFSRVEMLNGTIDFDTAPGRGTSVTIQLEIE